jgi:hypothetical protein
MITNQQHTGITTVALSPSAAPDLQECPVCHTIEDSAYMTGAVYQGRVAYFCTDCALPD